MTDNCNRETETDYFRNCAVVVLSLSVVASHVAIHAVGGVSGPDVFIDSYNHRLFLLTACIEGRRRQPCVVGRGKEGR